MRLGLTKSLKLSDVFGLGFMTFAFYLGAGNIIFPPLAGFMAGEHLLAAMCGFLLTAVGLPLITLIAVAKGGAGGGCSQRHPGSDTDEYADAEPADDLDHC